MPLIASVADKILDSVLATAYLSLHSADPGTTGAAEVSGGSYRRQRIPLSRSASGVRRNSGVVAFPMMPSASVAFVGLWTDSEGGELLWTAKLEIPKQAGPNDTVFFDPGDLEFGLKVRG